MYDRTAGVNMFGLPPSATLAFADARGHNRGVVHGYPNPGERIRHSQLESTGAPA